LVNLCYLFKLYWTVGISRIEISSLDATHLHFEHWQIVNIM